MGSVLHDRRHKIREVLRLQALGLSQRQIARSCSVGQSTVSEYLKAAAAASLSFEQIAGWEEPRLLEALFGKAPPAPQRNRLPEPDYARIEAELALHKHLTLQLLWEDYRAQHPEGYRYSRFCELYQRWRKQRQVVMRQEHRAGEKLFVDYAGATVAVRDPQTGESRPAQIFVAVLGLSNYTFAEATWSQGLADWIGSHTRAFAYFGGVPEIVVPDNLKAGIVRLGQSYPHSRVEAAALRAVTLNVCSYQSLRSILERNLDGLAPEPPPSSTPPLAHPGIGLGARTPAPVSHRTHRGRQDLAGPRLRPQSLPRRLHRALPSQLPVASWHAQIGDPTLADSILDRLVHNAHRIELSGESMRRKRAAKAAKETP